MGLAIPSHDLVHARLKAFGHTRVTAVDEVAREGEPDDIGVSLILAIGLRETWLRNIVGDGGHGRGFLQIDDRGHAAWLRSRGGCMSGHWDFAKGRTALDRGYVPGCTAAASRAVQLLQGNRAFATSKGVPSTLRHRFSIAAYNCGAGNALAGLRGQGTVDAYTTGRDYAHWVMAVQPMVVAELRKLNWFNG